MSRQENKKRLVEFLRTIQRPDHPINAADERENLFRAGLADSLAILQIVSYLEQNHGVNLSERGVDPDELSSIGGILDVIEQDGQ